ncbi:MAG: DUF4132 domain-containing protein [Deltaproteobacteria bacterium]|nr:DUF4132 domain-containing protein [Deltaproteobacteria bacterium]
MATARTTKPTSAKVAAKTAKAAKATTVAKSAKGSPAQAAKPGAKRPGAAGPVETAVAVDEGGLGWLPAGKYQLTLDGGKLVARNDQGKRLASVPKELKDGDVADQLEGLRDWLAEHDRACVATVEQWMLRSLPVPRAVLEGVWADASWRRPLENAVVVAVDVDGRHDHARAGLFRGVDAKKGVGIVDLDGETAWLETERVAVPHPILIPQLETWRDLVTQLGAQQGIAQLHRETHGKPAADTASAPATTITRFEDGKFATLMQAAGKARSLGYKIRGGFATCLVWDGGTVCEARYWIGADSPEAETYTGQLLWVDGKERGLPIAAVGPVAFSEGMRMAAAIYAARVVEKQEGTP